MGQVKTDEKSNEITAIRVIENFSLENTVVTIDAMGCQEKIAKTIIDKKADYVLAVKENQKQLYRTFKMNLDLLKTQICIDQDLDHGRIETRKCSIITDFKHIENTDKWKQLKSIIKMKSQRIKNSDKPIEKATRYYISSLETKAEDFQKAIRSLEY